MDFVLRAYNDHTCMSKFSHAGMQYKIICNIHSSITTWPHHSVREKNSLFTHSFKITPFSHHVNKNSTFHQKKKHSQSLWDPGVSKNWRRRLSYYQPWRWGGRYPNQIQGYSRKICNLCFYNFGSSNDGKPEKLSSTCCCCCYCFYKISNHYS